MRTKFAYLPPSPSSALATIHVPVGSLSECNLCQPCQAFVQNHSVFGLRGAKKVLEHFFVLQYGGLRGGS